MSYYKQIDEKMIKKYNKENKNNSCNKNVNKYDNNRTNNSNSNINKSQAIGFILLCLSGNLVLG